MSTRSRSILAAALLATPSVVRAQLDYRNLDDDRPTLIEDAYSVERYAFEFMAPWRYAKTHRAGSLQSFVPELEYGLLPNFHLGLKLPLARTTSAGRSDWGISGLRAFGLYNFNTESRGLPALALRADLSLPVGHLAGEGARVTAKAIATRSWGRTRLHLNAAWTFGADRSLAAAEPAHKWWAGGAVDHTLFRQSTLLIVELYGQRPSTGEAVEVNTSLGLRYQWTPQTVLDFGIARRLRATGPDVELTFGISRTFAFAGLMPGER